MIKSEKEYIKIYGIRIGSVNTDLLEMYRKLTKEPSIHKAVRKTVEKHILGYKIKEKSDVTKAMEYASNLYYNSICEVVEDIARTELKEKLPICKNCAGYRNGFCSMNELKVHPFSSVCVQYEEIAT